MTILHVAIGGALGAVLRYFCAISLAFPYATVVVNVLGSFLMGLALVMLVEKGMDRWQPFVMVGVLGGFTTYSTFSLDALRLFERGELGGALAYVVGTVVLCLAAVVAGAALARGFAA